MAGVSPPGQAHGGEAVETRVAGAKPRPRGPLALAAVLLVAHALAYVRWTEDDAGVSLRYADHLATGAGLVYNPSERVEAISNLGYVLGLAAGRLFLSDDAARFGLLVMAKLFGLVAGLVGLIMADRLGAAIGLAPRGRDFALCLVALSTPYAAWSVGALETPFVAAATTALLAAVAELGNDPSGRRGRRLASVASVALVLLRVDGFVAVLAATVVLLARPRTRRSAALAAIPLALTFLTLIAFRLAYYGHAMPSPVGAKIDLATSLERLTTTGAVYVAGFGSLYGHWLALAVVLAIAVRWPAHASGARASVAAASAALLAYVMLVGGDWMPLYRFLVPLVPLTTLLIVGAVERLLPARGIVPWALVLGLGAAHALLGHASFRTRRDAPLWYLHPTVSARSLHEFWLPAVDWLASNVARDATLLTSEAGFIPYLSRLRTIDSFGLATPAIAALPSGSVERSSLGVITRFVAGPPGDAAQTWIADVPAAALVLQDRMVAGWNDGVHPASLFAGRWIRTADSPIGAWAVYVPALSR